MLLHLALCALGDGALRPAPVATFSIAACDPETGEIGVAVQSKFIAVGSVVPWAKAGVGAVATQSFANVTYGPRGLKLLQAGKSPTETIALLTTDDPAREKAPGRYHQCRRALGQFHRQGMLSLGGEAKVARTSPCRAISSPVRR